MSGKISVVDASLALTPEYSSKGLPQGRKTPSSPLSSSSSSSISKKEKKSKKKKTKSAKKEKRKSTTTTTTTRSNESGDLDALQQKFELGIEDATYGADGADGAKTIPATIPKAAAAAAAAAAVLLPAEIEAEVTEAVSDLARFCRETESKVSATTSQSRAGQLPTHAGVSLLELKHLVLASYTANLAQYAMMRTEGIRVEDSAVVDRLIYLRTVLEKVRPLDRRIKYQVDKLIRAGSAADMSSLSGGGGGGGGGGLDPYSFRPNPSNLVPKSGGAAAQEGKGQRRQEEENKEGEGEGEGGLYRAPRLAAVPYEEDESEAAKRERKEASERRKLMASKMMSELRAEVSDRPMELTEYEASGIEKLGAEEAKKARERRRYEEENFVRLTVSKKDKKRYSKRKTSALQDIVDFGSFEGYDDGSAGATKRVSMGERVAGRKRARKSGGGGSGGNRPTEESF